jgi:DNA polymerase II small subunit/DNA polymerase delta subunit B
MDKKEIIRNLLKEKILLPPDLLDKINEENYKEILSSLKEREIIVEGEGKEELKIKTNDFLKGRKISVNDIVELYLKKYEMLKEILLKKIEAVSINKAKNTFSKVSIIGRVKDLTGRGFLLEDVTGEIEVVTKGDDISVGDVIGVSGFFKENLFFPEDIIFPDIPLINTQNQIEDLNIILTTKTKEAQDTDTVIVHPNEIRIKNEVVKNVSNPGWVTISKGERTMKILIYKANKEVRESQALTFLRKRILPEDQISVQNNVIEEIPNILWTYNNKANWTRNYKGVVLISSNEKSYVKYNTTTNIVEFVKYDAVG